MDDTADTPVTKAETREALAELAERRAASKWITAARLRHQLARYADVDVRNVALVSALDTIYLGDDEPYDAYMDAGALLGDAIAELVALRAVVAAAEAYHAACVATEEAYDGGAPGWGDRVSDAFVPRNEASDALRTAIAARQHAAPAPTREERP